MRGALLSVAVALATVGALAPPSGIAGACSCALITVADRLETADVVVTGRQIGYADLSPNEQTIDRRWLFEVDERYRGDVPDVIEVRAESELGACDDTVTRLTATLLLDAPTPEGWFAFPTCADRFTASDLVPYFDEVWAADGRGPPGFIAAVRTATHDMVVLDTTGRPLGYLPAVGATAGLSICPGSRTFLQLRVDGNGLGELAAWDMQDWSQRVAAPIGDVSDRLPEAPIVITCLDADGLRAYVSWDTGLDVDLATRAVTPRPEYRGQIAGLDGSLLTSDTAGWRLASADPNVPWVTFPLAQTYDSSISAASITTGGWQITTVHVAESGATNVTTQHVTPGAAVFEASTDVAIPVFPYVAVAIDPEAATGLPALPAGMPLPAHQRSGTRIDAPAPTLSDTLGPEVTGAPSSALTASVAAAEVAAVIAPKADVVDDGGAIDDGVSASAIVLVLFGVAAAGVAWALVRRPPREA